MRDGGAAVGDPHHVVRVEADAVHQQRPGRQDSGIVEPADGRCTARLDLDPPRLQPLGQRTGSMADEFFLRR